MYDWVRPEIIVPVHGEARHMAEQARLALAHGVPQAVVQKNGDVVRLAPGEPEEARRGARRPPGARRRRHPARRRRDDQRAAADRVNGLISVALPVGEDGKLAGTPLIRPFGVPVEDDRDDFIADATDAAANA